MEIRIRTYEELRTDRVTIEITGTGAEVTEFAETRLPSRNLYTDEEVASLQASEAELVAGPFQARINELEDKLIKAENKIRGYDHDRHTERDRADRAVRTAREQESRADELDRRLSTSLARVEELESLLAREVKRAEDAETKLMEGQDKAVTKAAVTMAEAIGKVLDTLT